MQTCRPCWIMRWLKSIHCVAGTIAHQILLDFHRVCLFSKAQPVASRATCVSTTTPEGMPKAVPSTTLAVLRPTPGSTTRLSMSRRAPLRHGGRASAWQQALMFFALLRKKPVLLIAFSSWACGAGRNRRPYDTLEQLLGHDIDPHIGTLGRENRGHEQLERRIVNQGALGRRVHRGQLAADANGMTPGCDGGCHAWAREFGGQHGPPDCSQCS